ncbi:type II toxin-antitoxin system RelE/ParE family toxin [Budviciaceae bacterium CWB-B4]|uniref:Toxin n=1 Tax=Limnobaculum xujianqingii TaxID=2738837 RepID=A0A9D7AJ73_9GAMM|nr:type II toxin-antitoxin system RelE/ParE family toxin [Limnobaculum xujianqingii]MBK5073392.1 type II toxin-antitoxin system RelE/ParE family toxin [Limnobaculum xujianqingii]MBK5176877.1 type II toxin-antitoxin system RelE/ParE family toxin [Limnobaculum xujianqingii]
MRKYKLSKLADEDIYQIARYTIQQLGQRQAKRYYDELKKTFELLALSPWIGRECDWLCEGTRRFEFKKHSIYYILQNDDIFISRVIHQSMDVEVMDFFE